MKTVAPSRIAAYITLSFLVLAIMLFAVYSVFEKGLIALLIAIPVFTAIVFFVVHYFLNVFIYEKIKPTTRLFTTSSPQQGTSMLSIMTYSSRSTRR
jgi:two-component system phosphate regulon sensor histidine kinase PhoR